MFMNFIGYANEPKSLSRSYRQLLIKNATLTTKKVLAPLGQNNS